MKYILPAAACIALLLFLVFEGGRENSPEIPSATPAPASTTDLLLTEDLGREAPRLELEEDEPSTAPAGPPVGPPADGRDLDPADYESAEELLADYWQDLWPDVRAELVDAGLDLETYPFAELKTWTEVRTTMADQLLRSVEDERDGVRAELEAWSSPETAAEGLGRPWTTDFADRPDLRVAWREVQAYSQRIGELARNLHSGLDVLFLDALDNTEMSTVHPIGFPRRTLGAEELRIEDYVVAKAAAVEGWAFELLIHRDDHPEIASWLDELELLRTRRRQAFDLFLGS